MKKILFCAAVAAAAMTSCSKNEITNSIEDAPQAITFGTYVGNASSKAAVETAGAAKETFVEGDSFGVFAYYTEAAKYVAGSEAPDFMYNQKVTKGATVAGSITDWTYTPLKYWPNGVTSDNKPGMISFFAYWPMVTDDNNLKLVTPAGADFIATSETDPCVEYSLVNGENIDLMWAVDNATGEGQGLPFVDQTKQESTDKMTFQFKHALARVAFQFQLADDIVAATEETTTVTIDKIEFGGTLVANDIEAALTPALTPSALLNLNNTTANTPNWISPATTGLTQLLLETADFTKGGKFTRDGSTTEGEESAAFNGGVINNTDEDYLMIIPQNLSTGDVVMRVTYTVSTEDDAYGDGATVDVKNVFTFDLQDFVGGTAYLYDMTIGLNSVKVDAAITAWPDEANSDVKIVIADSEIVTPQQPSTQPSGAPRK